MNATGYAQYDENGPDNLPLYEATALTEGGPVARIRLDDQLYVLRITRAGKLILTK